MSERLREKSEDTTQREPVMVSRARKRPLGDGRMWENGPREMRCRCQLVRLLGVDACAPDLSDLEHLG